MAGYGICNGSAASGSTTLTVTVGAGTGTLQAPAIGDLVHLEIGVTSPVSVVSVTDSQGQSYPVQVLVPSGNQQAFIASLINTKNLVLGTDTYTVAFSGTGGNKLLIARGCPGVASATADKTDNAGNITSTAPSSGSTGTLSQAHELVVGAIENAGAGGTPSGLSFGTGFSITQGGVLTEFDEFVSSTAAQTASGTIASALWGAAIATFPLSAPSITPTTLPGVTSGGSYSQSLSAGGVTPDTYAITSGSLSGSGISMNSAGVFSGTAATAGTYSFTVTVTDSAGQTASQAFTIVVSPAAAAATFPADPLPIVIEILLNGTWTDISEFVYQRDPIQISGGTSAQGSSSQPAQCTMTLNNRDGRFTPAYAGGAYYPYLTRGIQLRVSVQGATSSLGAAYTGFRFWGTVADWPPISDISGQDVYEQITASGPLRQVGQNGNQASPLFNYYQSLQNTEYYPVAYWPVEDDVDSLIIGSGVDGGVDMTVAAGTPLWKGSSDFPGSGPVARINKSTWTGVTGSFGSSGDDVFDTPGVYQWVASTSSVNVRCWGGGGGGTKGQVGTSGGNGGGGGEYAQEATLAVTPGQVYTVVVGAGGVSGLWNAGGGAGGTSSFTGDSATVTAHGGAGATASGHAGGTAAGGTGSTNTVHHNGGTGGYDNASVNGGAGGGGSGGASTAGGPGQNSQSGASANGGAPGSGTPSGAFGGSGGYQAAGRAGGLPGAGGGGGWANNSDYTQGGGGTSGQVELLYAGSAGGTQVLTSGTQWVCPPGVTSVKVECVAGGGGGGNSAGGGGGEYAAETAIAVTAGNTYSYSIGAAGTAAATGTAGGNTTFTGDSATVTAHGGGGGGGGSGGTGGTGYTSGTHHNGGAGYASFIGIAGGGSSGGSSSAGNAGTVASGGAAVTGGGPGGNSSSPPSTGPGGGGGNGAHGAKGQITITTAAGGTQPPWNILRLITETPTWGIYPSGAVIARMLTSGTIARLDVIGATGGKLRLKGYDASSSLLFTSSDLTVGDGKPLMVSAELTNSGTNVAWKLEVIGARARYDFIGTLAGTQATASVGSVTQVIVNPNGDITKTAVGQIAVQYQRLSLYKVSQAFAGNTSEMGIDRFVRLCGELALGGEPQYSEQYDHWGFEGSNQSWAGTNCTLTHPATTFKPADTDQSVFYTRWPPEGTHSLLLTASGAGQPTASSPTGTAGQPVSPGDIVSATCEVYVPAALSHIFIGILWYQGSGAASAITPETDSADYAMTAGQMRTITVKGTAPADATLFAIITGDHNADAASTKIFADNVRVSPQMGTQTRASYKAFLEQVQDLEQGMLKEAKDIWGLKYRTRISLINQTPAVVIDYSLSQLSQPLAPVFDDKLTANTISVNRNGGSHVTVSEANGTMSTSLPPQGVGKHSKAALVIADDDNQLLALAQHLLNLGTSADERYPAIDVDLSRAEVAAPGLFDAIPAVEIGDYVQVVNLPFWFPGATADQLVVGYTETLGPFSTWTIEWNCQPESPYALSATSIRRW